MVGERGIRKSRQNSDKTIDATIHIILILLALICLYPLYQVFVVSISDPAIVMRKNGFLLIPEGLNIDAYKIVFANRNIRTGFINTFFYIVVGTSMQFVVSTLASYALSKKNLLLKKPILIFFAITMYFGGGMIPFYVLINSLNLMNTPWAILLPGACNVWNIIILRTHFVNIPDGLKESAMIDGANDFSILLRIMLPLSGAVIAVLVLFSVVSYWNMWYEPMLYLSKREQYPIQSVLREILIDNSTQMMAGAGASSVKFNVQTNKAGQTLVKYANIIVCTMPILLIYPFVQKYFVKGVMVGSLKG